MKTLKLFAADGRALTDLASNDDSILLPNAITVYECEVIAHHADSGDTAFDSLEDLCAEYGLDIVEVRDAVGEIEEW